MEHEIRNHKPESLESRPKLLLGVLYAISIGGGLWNAVRGYPSFMVTIMPVFCVGIAFAAFVLMYTLTARNLFAALAVVLLAFISEASGANIGFPYGDYAFTSALGPKLLDVPIVIPFFWFAVLVISWSASDRFLLFKHLVVASIIVVAFDAVLEFSADSIGLWHWQGGVPTELNFISRFALAWLGLSILKRFATEKKSDPILPHLLIVQLLYLVMSDIGIRFFSPLA
jgi:uncharacterized membrane protein